MKIASIKISVFDMPGNTGRFDLREVEQGAWRRWVHVRSTQRAGRRACVACVHR